MLEVRNQTRLLPRFVRPPTESGAIPWPPGFRTLLCGRAIIQLHVDRHINRQLRQLSGAYLRTEMLISGTSSELTEERRRLSSLREECQQFSASLSDVRRRVSAFVLGVTALIPLFLVFVKIRTVPLSHLLGMMLTLATYVLLFLPGIFALLAYTDAFRCKRRLFLSYRAPGAQSAEHAHQSIYRLETLTFDLLNQPKLSERISDCWANVIVLVAGTVFVVRQVFVPAVPNSIGIIQEVIAYLGSVAVIAFLTRAVVVNIFRRQRQER